MRKILLLMLLAILGGAGSVKAETVKLYSTGLTDKGGNVNYADGTLTWTSNGDNVYNAIKFDAGVLSYFSKIKFTCSGLTSGAKYRVIVTVGSNFQVETDETGDVEINIADLTYQYGNNKITAEQIASATAIRIGGGSTAGTEGSLTIDPTSIYLETSWDAPMEIGTTADWGDFKKLVNSGLSSLNATLTADVDAGSTMVGTSSKPYTGTFDGAGHTLTFTYDGSTSNEIAPFQYINNATINNLTTAGSINAQNIFGGIVGTAGGASTLNYCTSNMVLTANDNGDSNNGRVAGLVGRCADNAYPVVGTSITFNNCMFGGSISSTTGSRCCGLVSWARSTTVIANNCLIAPTSVTNGAENIAATGGTDPVVTPTNCYYTERFGGSSQGTSATAAQIASGELCYLLNGNAVPSTSYFFGQNLKALSSSPMLTSNTAYKVYSLGGGEYANMINTIASTEDWVLFSKLVAAGETNMDVTMTADVNAGNTMVGNESNKYAGTFDGAGHTLTFNYKGTSSMVAPFKEVHGATIIDLKTTGSITSEANLLAGIVGQVNGATTLTRCASNMSITTTVGTNGRIGGLVARNGQTGSSLTLNNCMYNGAINSASNQAAGFVGWSPNATTISNCLVAASSITGGESNFTPNPITIPDGKYALYISKFGSSTQGTAVTEAQRYNGYVAYTLNQGIGSGALFFGQGNLNTSIVDDLPMLTTDVSKKVWGKTPAYTGTMVYMNAGGAIPNAVRLKALGWYFDGVESHVVNTVPADINDETVLRRTMNYYPLKVGLAGATTLVVPFTTTSLPTNVKAYNLAFDGSVVNAVEVDHLTANKPVLINAPAGEYLFSAGTTGLTDLTLETGDNAWIAYSAGPTNGALTGVYNNIAEQGQSPAYDPFSYVPKDAYVLQNGPEGLCFYQVDAENTIKITSFRAYLTADALGARALTIKFPDDETAINQVQGSRVKVQDSEIFNLAGQRMSKLQKGVNIVNGKKIMVK